MDRNCRITQHCLRTGRRDFQKFRRILNRIPDVIEIAIYLNRLDLKIGNYGFAVGAPVCQVCVAIHQPIVVELDERGANGFRQTIVQRETFAFPIARAADLAQLLNNCPARFTLPVPHSIDEFLSSKGLPRGSPGLQLLLHDNFGDDSRMIRARHPKSIVTLHPFTTNQDIL